MHTRPTEKATAPKDCRLDFRPFWWSQQKGGTPSRPRVSRFSRWGGLVIRRGKIVSSGWKRCSRGYWGFLSVWLTVLLSRPCVNLLDAPRVPLRDPVVEGRLKKRPAPVALLGDLGGFKLLKVKSPALPAREARPLPVKGKVQARRVMGAPHLPGGAVVALNDGSRGMSFRATPVYHG